MRYVRCDVTSYEDNLRLFDTAFNAFGRIDHAWSNAGIVEQGDIFDPSLTLDNVKAEPNRSLKVLDVNLKGPIYFARIASVYLRQGDQSGDRSLLFTSSVGMSILEITFLDTLLTHCLVVGQADLERILACKNPACYVTLCIC